MLSRSLWGSLILLVPLVTHAVASPPKAITGLKILNTTVEKSNADVRTVVVRVQNITNDKTIVGYAFLARLFDKDAVQIGDPAGTALDFADPDNSNTRNFILPGQIATIQVIGTTGERETVFAEVSVTGVVYEDSSSEGAGAQMFFATRRRRGQELREAAAKEQLGDRKADLERQAAWYEAHGPKGEVK